MGTYRAGRKPKPTALKVLEGSRLTERNRTEPQYAVRAPRCPPHISSQPAVKAKWNELVRRFRRSRVLTEAHGEALAILAATWVDYERDYQMWAGMGFPPVLDNFGKGAQIHPLATRVERLREQLYRRLGEFGATPVMGPKVVARPATEQKDSTLETLQQQAAGLRRVK